MNLPNRNATPTNFGFQFQINVAVYFMFKYLRDLKYIRVEGEKEDVELTLKNDEKYMIQAKSITSNLYSDSNNNAKLKSALIGLAESDSKNVKYMFYASNIVNPLNTQINEFPYESGIITKMYSELSPDSKEKIDSQVKSVIDSQSEEDMRKLYNIDRDKLVIIRIPFFGEFESERYRHIYNTVCDSLSNMSENLSSKKCSVVKYWESKFLNNSATNPRISINKNEICNCLILTEIDSYDLSSAYGDIGIEEVEYDAAYMKYRKSIDDRVNRYESITKVYSLYSRRKQKSSISITNFVKEERVNLYNYFFNRDIKRDSELIGDEKMDLYVSQIISYAILKKKVTVDKIREEAGE